MVAGRLARAEDIRARCCWSSAARRRPGIVYATDAAASAGVVVAGTFPKNTRDPITYPFAVMRDGDTPEACALLLFLAGPEARAIFGRRGFTAAGIG